MSECPEQALPFQFLTVNWTENTSISSSSAGITTIIVLSQEFSHSGPPFLSSYDRNKSEIKISNKGIPATSRNVEVVEIRLHNARRKKRPSSYIYLVSFLQQFGTWWLLELLKQYPQCPLAARWRTWLMTEPCKKQSSLCNKREYGWSNHVGGINILISRQLLWQIT